MKCFLITGEYETDTQRDFQADFMLHDCNDIQDRICNL